MNILRSILVVLMLCCWGSFSLAATSKPTSKPVKKAKSDRFAWVDSKAKAYVKSAGLPGLSIGVVEGNRLVWSKHYGFANQKTRTRATNQTLYKIGSISKVFTSMLMVSLRDEGKLRLDDSLSSFLPKGTKLPSDPRGLSSMTLRHLSTHTSGLPSLPPNLSPKGQDPYNNYTSAGMFAALPTMSLKYPVGARYSYSNMGTALLGYAMSQRTKQSYEQLLQQRILKPLGMKNTSSVLDKKNASKLAVGYGRRNIQQVAPPWNLGMFAPAGSIVSSVEDLAKFLSFQFRAGQANVKPVSGGSLLEMQSTHRSLGYFKKKFFNASIGLGWHIFPLHKRKDKVIWHNGGVAGFRSYIGFSPLLKKGVIVLTNSGRSADSLGFSLMEGLSKRYWTPPKNQVSPKLVRIVKKLKKYFVAKPDKSVGKLFSPLFLQQIPLPRLQMMFAQYAMMLGTPTFGKVQASSTPNLGYVNVAFSSGRKLTLILAIDSSREGRIVMMFLRPPKKKPPTKRASPHPTSKRSR